MFYVYSKIGCKFCDKAKELLKSNYILFKEITLDPSECDYIEKRNELFSKWNVKSFPVIIENVIENENTLIGGYTELYNKLENEF